jgi:hypothetical protein
MKIKHRTDRMEIEVEGGDVKDCFIELANAVEVFSQSVCQACESPDTMPRVREKDGNSYFEVFCNSCNAALSFGQTRVGNRLYPRRKGKDGSYLPHHGWVKWQPKQDASFDDAF